MKRIKVLALFAACISLCSVSVNAKVYASEGEEYITISVDATDDNDNLKYALDTDDPSAFTDSNEFTVPAGTSHTIYVKDVAGNITSQTYIPNQSGNTVSEPDENEQQIKIDLEIGNQDKKEEPDYEYLTGEPVEPGTGTVAEKVKTDGSDDAEKIFYTFTTKEGEVLYLVIDQGQSSDNVYLLDTVSIGDLQVLADGNVSSNEVEEEDNLLAALAKESEDETTIAEDSAENEKKSSAAATSRKYAVLLLIIAAIGGGAYYYFKIYKNKKDEAMDVMDAMDMDEFEPEEEEEEIDFDLDDSDKEKFLEDLVNEDETFLDVEPEEYAMSHMDDNYDSGVEFPEDEEFEGEVFGEDEEDV